MDVDRFQYLILMGLCLVVTLPLEFVFGARVWRRPRRLLAALAVPVAIFVVWHFCLDDCMHSRAFMSPIPAAR